MNAYNKQICHSLMLKNNPLSLFYLPMEESIISQNLNLTVKISLINTKMVELLAVETLNFLTLFTMKAHKSNKKDYQKYPQ